MRRAALIVVWLGCAVLLVRGGAGLIDDLTRAVGLLPNGIIGLPRKQTMGAAYYRSVSALWSADLTDAYFFAGGLLLACWPTATARDIKAPNRSSARPPATDRPHAPVWSGAQAELWPDWRHFAFLTNRVDTLAQVEAEHRQHAVVELAIRDLKD